MTASTARDDKLKVRIAGSTYTDASPVCRIFFLNRQYHYYMKFKEIFADACTVAGASVGVGFLSGKEAQTFLGSYANLAIFGLCFFSFCVILREFCRKKRCFDVENFCQACFGRFSVPFLALMCVCCFVCAVSALAALEDCLESFLPVFPLPAYAFLTAALSAYIMKKGIAVLKILNVLQMAMAFFYILTVCLLTQKGVAAQSNGKPMVYALFDATVSVGILAPLAKQSAKQNVAASAVATLMLCLLTFFVMFFGNFSSDMPFFCSTDNILINIFLAVTLILATMTGVVANLLPVVQFVNSALDDTTLSTLCVFCLAVAFSMFGFDFALKYGYVFVACIGGITAITIVGMKLNDRKDIRSTSISLRR